MKQRSTGWLAAPAVAYLAILFIGPAATVLAYSLCQRDVYGGVRPALSWDAWEMAIDPVTRRIVGRTVLLAAAVTLANLLVAYPCAAILAGLPRRQRALLVLVI